jgi:hypothetical protein
MFRDIPAVRRAVENSQDVLTVSMENLRDAYGASKLGKIVVENISKALKGQGLGHYPNPLPNYQEGAARIYKIDSHVGQIIEAVFEVGDANDAILRQATEGEANALIQKIRELVCD